MGTITSDDLTWNGKKKLPVTQLTESTVNMEVDGGPDSNYLLVIKSTKSENFSGTIKAGDFWMQGQGDKTFEVTSSQSYSHAVGPFESGRFMKSDSTIQVTADATTAIGDLQAGLLKVPKP